MALKLLKVDVALIVDSIRKREVGQTYVFLLTEGDGPDGLNKDGSMPIVWEHRAVNN
jgi:hypothetical protein